MQRQTFNVTLVQALDMFGFTDETFTAEDVNRIFRDLSRVCHPDNKDTGDRFEFQQLNESKMFLLYLLEQEDDGGVPLGLTEQVRWIAGEMAQQFLTALVNTPKPGPTVTTTYVNGYMQQQWTESPPITDAILIMACKKNIEAGIGRRIISLNEEIRQTRLKIDALRRVKTSTRVPKAISDLWEERVGVEEKQLHQFDLAIKECHVQYKALEMVCLVEDEGDVWINGRRVKDILEEENEDHSPKLLTA